MSGAELGLAQALDQLVQTLAPITGRQLVATRDAYRRVLAEDVIAALDLPGFDNSAMDGYALRAADVGATFLHEIGRSYAGHGFAGRVETGTCVRIMTGAPLPAGADTVVVMEDVSHDAGTVRIERIPKPGANIRRRGEHIARGAVVLRSGRELRAADIGLASSVGAATMYVFRRLRVGVASTGDELADPPQPLAEFGSYDANRPLLELSLRAAGFEAHDLGICIDAPEAFAALLTRAFALELDVLVVSGGAAQGDADVVRRIGGIRFVPLNIRPGRGVAIAAIERDGHRLQLLGLPGNAVAAFVMFHLLARPLLLHLAGASTHLPTHVSLPLANDVHLRGGRIDYRRARLQRDQHGRVCIEPLPAQGSAMLRTVVDADALIALGPGDIYRAGDLVDTVLLDALE